MALPLLIRRGPALIALPSLMRGSSKLITNNTKYFTQLAQNNVKQPFKITNKINWINPIVKRGMSADHGKLWALEKILSAALLGLVPAAIILPNALFDHVLCIITVLHMHWGLESAVRDYVRAVIFGPVIPKLAILLLYTVSVLTLAGLTLFNVNDIGVGRAIRKFWAIKN